MTGVCCDLQLTTTSFVCSHDQGQWILITVTGVETNLRIKHVLMWGRALLLPLPRPWVGLDQDGTTKLPIAAARHSLENYLMPFVFLVTGPSLPAITSGLLAQAFFNLADAAPAFHTCFCCNILLFLLASSGYNNCHFPFLALILRLPHEKLAFVSRLAPYWQLQCIIFYRPSKTGMHHLT